MTTKVFVLFDSNFPAYPIVGIFSSLEKAVAVAWEEGPPSLALRIYEEEIDQTSVEPVLREIPQEKP
jgi:hypothetical protein